MNRNKELKEGLGIVSVSIYYVIFFGFDLRRITGRKFENLNFKVQQ